MWTTYKGDSVFLFLVGHWCMLEPPKSHTINLEPCGQSAQLFHQYLEAGHELELLRHNVDRGWLLALFSDGAVQFCVVGFYFHF